MCPDITAKLIDQYFPLPDGSPNSGGRFGEKKDRYVYMKFKIKKIENKELLHQMKFIFFLSRILKFRKTLHGELGWISTGLFEAIAWDSLMKSEKSTVESFKLFHDCFRCDSLLSALYRSFVLADRILRSYGCNPQENLKKAFSI